MEPIDLELGYNKKNPDLYGGIFSRVACAFLSLWFLPVNRRLIVTRIFYFISGLLNFKFNFPL